MMISARLLSLRQVLDAERPAWSLKGDTEFYYDGILAMIVTPRGCRTAPLGELPQDDRWHKEGCSCSMCTRDAVLAECAEA